MSDDDIDNDDDDMYINCEWKQAIILSVLPIV